MSSPEPRRPVAFYVHHHGGGHANRCRLLARHLPPGTPVHVFTSAPERFADWRGGTLHPLPPDTETGRDPTDDLLQDRILHYAPVDLPNLQQRMAILSRWIADHRPSLFIVDLSVEVALFTRLCGARTALMRLHGRRDDAAHEHAFRLVDHLLAPFPRALEDAHTPAWVRDKTVYLGAFSRYDDRRDRREECRRALGLSGRVVTVVNGRGGGARVPGLWNKIAHRYPVWTILVVGKLDRPTGPSPPNIRWIGFVDDTFPYLRAADVVVGSGGTNTMMEIGAARVPYLSLPEARPFDEQYCKMKALERLGLTRIVEGRPDVATWRRLLDEATRMDVMGWDELFSQNSLSSVFA